jgi:hypothetical protein
MLRADDLSIVVERTASRVARSVAQAYPVMHFERPCRADVSSSMTRRFESMSGFEVGTESSGKNFSTTYSLDRQHTRDRRWRVASIVFERC